MKKTKKQLKHHRKITVKIQIYTDRLNKESDKQRREIKMGKGGVLKIVMEKKKKSYQMLRPNKFIQENT